MRSPTRLPDNFYIENDALTVARELLGHRLLTCIDGRTTGGIITETEAYIGPIDKASHTYQHRRTPRTEMLFRPGGRAYVYFIYGLHNMFNVSVGPEDVPECVLIRALKPTVGIEFMQERRFGPGGPDSHTADESKTNKLTNGPANLTKALAIDKGIYGLPMDSSKIWIEKHSEDNLGKIEATPRIGIDYAEEFKDKPWRFVAGTGM